MNAFSYQNRELYAEQVPVRELAERYGTPLYIYSRTHIRNRYRRMAEELADFNPLICYSIKANSCVGVIQTLVEEGSGFDIVSGGELFRALRAGADPSRIVFAGVGKTAEEIEYALQNNILFFTAESLPEAVRISDCAEKLNTTARIVFRVNPAVDAKTHSHMNTGKADTKFGIDISTAEETYASAARLPGLAIAGVHMHIGSQILDVEPFGEALSSIAMLAKKLKATYESFTYLDIGGGMGICYEPGHEELSLSAFSDTIRPYVEDLGLQLVLEPGRYIVGNAAILVARVEYVKENRDKRFVIADAAMNDLIRPVLYDAYHGIMPVAQESRTWTADLVGPVCESGDFMAKARELPVVSEGDLLAIADAGAYAFVMSSNYNSRPRAAEVVVENDRAFLARKRETWEDLIRLEEKLPEGDEHM